MACSVRTATSKNCRWWAPPPGATLPSRHTNLTLPHAKPCRVLAWTLHGTIPDEIGQLTQLTTLMMRQSTGLVGTIPTTVGQLTQLERLDMGYCGLSGSIPATIGQLTQMARLDLSKNSLTGSLPTSMTQLTKLTAGDITKGIISELDLSCNMLSGPVPALDFNQGMMTCGIGGGDNVFCNPLPHDAASCDEMGDVQTCDCDPGGVCTPTPPPTPIPTPPTPSPTPQPTFKCVDGQCIAAAPGLPMAGCAAICNVTQLYQCVSNTCTPATSGLPKAACEPNCGKTGHGALRGAGSAGVVTGE